MKWFLLLTCFLVSLASSAQVDSTLLARSTRMNQSGCQQLHWLPDDPAGTAAVALAERDIQAKTPFLILVSGEAPVAITTDAAFEQQFKIEYYEMGCISPSPVSVRAYNARMFAYLQATYGKAWRRRIRPDVVGLSHWKPRP
jgi:hypothetical protein